METFLTDSKYITKMGIKQTTTSQILNWLLRLNTNGNIRDAIKMIRESGLNLVEGVGLLKKFQPTTMNEKMELVRGVSLVALNTLLKINESVKQECNFHSTVKPLTLMRYLITLITPPNGIVLDPFCGSGSTLICAKQLGFTYIGCDMSKEYIAICRKRIRAVKAGISEREE